METRPFFSAIHTQGFNRLKRSVILLLILPICFSYYYPEDEQYKCILNCNSDECLVVDEENCACVAYPVCEAEKFCGGDLEDCRCKEEDGSS